MSSKFALGLSPGKFKRQDYQHSSSAWTVISQDLPSDWKICAPDDQAPFFKNVKTNKTSPSCPPMNTKALLAEDWEIRLRRNGTSYFYKPSEWRTSEVHPKWFGTDRLAKDQEVRFTTDGRMYFADRQRQATTWYEPWISLLLDPRITSNSEQSLPPLFSESPSSNSPSTHFIQSKCNNLRPDQLAMNKAATFSAFSSESIPIPCQHLYLDKLIEVFRSGQIKACRNARCMAFWEALGKLIPRCPSWPAIEGWVRQIVACYCSIADDRIRKLPTEGFIEEILFIADMYWQFHIAIASCSNMREMHRCQQVPDADWRHGVILFELSLLFSWLSRIIPGKLNTFMEPTYVVDLLGSRYQSTVKDMLLPKYVNNALQRAAKLALCPHRVWAVVGSLPMREYLLAGLIPDLQDGYPPFNVAKHSETHKSCTLDFCQESTINSTKVEQLHLCGNPPASTCKLTPAHMFPPDCLNAAANDKKLTTAWALDGRRVLSRGQSYMAISHVWADGTGVGIGMHGSVHECLYNFFRNIAHKLGCDGIWWDTICIPTEKTARARAINNMHSYYSDATCTLVHDRYLSVMPWTDAESACFAIVMSSWFTRGWTALELAKSKNVIVVFASMDKRGYVLKNLDKDILAQPGTLSSLPRQIATEAVRALRSGIQNVNDLLTSIGPRSTSWSRDRAIISGLLAGADIDDSKDSQRTIYQKAVVKLGRIHDSNLFHTQSVVERGGFSWLPDDFFKLPVAPAGAQLLAIRGNGDLMGKWYAHALSPPQHGEPILINTFVWGYAHSVTELRVKLALMDSPTDHIILTEENDNETNRGLLVRVLRPLSDKESNILRCQLVGQVHFKAARLQVRSAAGTQILVRIVGDSSGVSELDRDLNGDTAIKHLIEGISHHLWDVLHMDHY